MSLMTDAPAPDDLIFTVPSQCARAERSAPFAKVELGQKRFLIAEWVGDGESAAHAGLSFCEEGSDTWYCLSRVLEEGWTRIGADLLMADPMVLHHFLMTHAVRLRGWYRVGERITFDTMGTTWSVALPRADCAVVTLGADKPVPVDPRKAASTDLREQAIELLIAARPDLPQVFGDKIAHWAYRIASGVRVLPVM